MFGIGGRQETYVLISKQIGIVQLSSGFDCLLLLFEILWSKFFIFELCFSHLLLY